VEEDLDPAYVVLGGVGMGNFFPDGDPDLKGFPALDRVRAFDHRNVFFRFPVRFLKKTTQFFHDFTLQV